MIIHTVRSGETLWSIANFYRVSTSDIVEINELTYPNRLVIGQALVIPTEDTYHIVRPGESLWRIAQTYRISVQAILDRNQIPDPNRINPGAVLYIPAPRHIVQPGETLWLISQRYGVSLQTLMKINDITDPNLIYPGTVLMVPIKQRRVVDVNGFIYILGERAAPIVRDAGEHLTYLSPFAYRIKEDGGLEQIDDIPAINAAYAENVVPMMAITNFTSTELGENLAHAVLSNNQIVERLLDNVVSIMDQKGYMGLNIDFENVLPDDRENYNRFIQRAVDRLHPLGYFVSSSLAPKASAAQTGLLYTAHDYPAHGRILDWVVLMTYEWGYRLGPPRAISPVNEIRRVLDYAVSVMPRYKIFLGFQIYARDWLLPHVRGQEAETFSNKEALERAIRHGVNIQYDETAKSPFYRYWDTQGRQHEVWFEDARSAQAKFDLVKEYNLGGISYWALGYPYPENWALLEDNFTIRKLL
ncbi:MAG: LysM peptidoglycan-binding domain-containing protein [Ruminiclostridium sp.]|nr:LysM peptidoglycan-binding domain-containing protein [Ruminiclostridium sp.]